MVISFEPLRRVLTADTRGFSFPSQCDAVKAFALSRDRNAWRGERAHDAEYKYFASFDAARSQADRLRVQGTRFLIDEVAAALIAAAPGYLLLIHPTWGQHSRKVNPDFGSKASLSEFLSALERFPILHYMLPDEQRELLSPLTLRLRCWSSHSLGVDELFAWDSQGSRSSGHLIRKLCAVATAIGHEDEEGRNPNGGAPEAQVR